MNAKTKAQTCKICNRTLASASSYYVHMKQHSDNKPFGCSRCDAAFCRKPYLEVGMFFLIRTSFFIHSFREILFLFSLFHRFLFSAWYCYDSFSIKRNMFLEFFLFGRRVFDVFLDLPKIEGPIPNNQVIEINKQFWMLILLFIGNF